MNTALDIIRYISSEIECAQIPPRQQMLEEVQMMHFKIRPVLGDIAMIEKVGNEFIEVLWKIGKIDEVINLHIDGISEDEQDVLLDYFQSREEHMRGQMKDSITYRKGKSDASVLKLEIFKEDIGPSYAD